MGCNACFRPSLQININTVCNKRRDINFPFCSLIDKMKVIPNKTENKKSILDLETSKCINFLCTIREHMLRTVSPYVFIGFFFLKILHLELLFSWMILEIITYWLGLKYIKNNMFPWKTYNKTQQLFTDTSLKLSKTTSIYVQQKMA